MHQLKEKEKSINKTTATTRNLKKSTLTGGYLAPERCRE